MFSQSIVLTSRYKIQFHRIGGYHWRKAVARDWYANGVSVSLAGKLEMFQQSEYDLTNVEVHFKELNDNSGYHVHVVSKTVSVEWSDKRE